MRFNKETIYIIRNYFLFALIISALFLPKVSFAQSNQASAGRGLLSGITDGCYNHGNCLPCDIAQIGANVLVLVRDVSFFITIGMIVVSGIMMMLAGVSIKLYKSAWSAFRTALIGFILVFLVTLIMNTVLVAVTGDAEKNWESFYKGYLNCESSENN